MKYLIFLLLLFSICNADPQGFPFDTSINTPKLSSGFYAKRQHGQHSAWDLELSVGTPLRAVMDGDIEFFSDGIAGKYVLIKDGNWESGCAHLSKFETRNIQHGRVKFGDVIGYSGNTGESTGPHVHWWLSYNGKKVNPISYTGRNR